MSEPTPADYLVVSMARLIPNRATVATGVLSWLPMLAIGVARETHAPQLTYLNCAGAINPSFEPLPRSSTDVRLARNNPYCLRLTDLWDFATRGSVDVMFFGFAQLDRKGNTNLSWLRRRNGRSRKLGGVAGAFALRQLVKTPILFSPRHSRSTFVKRLDAVTTVAPSDPVRVVTDLGVLEVHQGKLRILTVHPTSSLREVEQKTGFSVERTGRLHFTPPPTAREWHALRMLDRDRIRNRYGEP